MDPREFLISASELRARLGEVVLVDCREPEEWAESRIEGATLIPLGEIQSRGPRELDPDSEIVIYCAHGVRSLHALMALRALGFGNLRSLQGGICAWQESEGA